MLITNQMLVDGIEDMVFVMRVEDDGERLFYQIINETARESLLHKEVIGKELREVLDQLTAEHLYRHYRKAIDQRTTHDYEDVFFSPLGEECFAKTTLTPVVEGGRVTCVVGVTRDITEQKKLEKQRNISMQRLKVSRQRYKSLFEESTQPIIYINKLGKIIRMNKACRRFFSQIYQKNQERYFFDILKTTDQELMIQKFKETKQGKPQSLEVTIMSENHFEVKLQIEFIPMMVDREVEGVYLMLKDMTAELFAKDALMKSEERFRLIVENSSDLIQIIDRNGRFTYVSPSHERVLGFSMLEFSERSIDDLVADEHKELILDVLEQTHNEDHAKKLEVKFRNASGKSQWFELKIEPVFTSDGLYHHTNIVARDIEERKKYEKELRRLAFRDPLTGLANRRLFDDRMHKVNAKAERDQIPFAVVMLDLDDFKSINDQFGHDAGDQVIIQISKRLLNTVREMDTVGRLGGDEFIILLPEIGTKENLNRFIKRFEANLDKPFLVENQLLTLCVSFGAVLSDRKSINRPNSIIIEADRALYEAKRSGKNRSIIL